MSESEEQEPCAPSPSGGGAVMRSRRRGWRHFGLLDRLISFLRREAVLSIAFVCALVSCAFVPIGPETLAAIDLRVIVLLFCLMATVAGLRTSGFFSWCALRLLTGSRSVRVLAFILVMLPFFASMLVTNDVALVAFVPFAVMALHASGHDELLVRVIVLQAVAANLGGMVTPVGNPQNLFIYTAYGLGPGEFFATLLPFAALTFVLLAAACARMSRAPITTALPLDETRIAPRRFAFYLALFVLCLLSVARVLP